MRRGDYLFWILAALFGIATQAVVLMPVVWAIWGVEPRIWNKRWDGTFGITLLVLWVAAALLFVGCEGLGLAFLSPFEIVVVGPALILVRDDLRDVELHR